MKTILVIEDDRAVASLIRDVLTEAGHRVLADQDGEAGLWTFQRNAVDLIIVDILIPKLIGFDLVQELRSTERGRQTPVIVMSGVYHAAVHRTQMIEKFGIADYFDKPLDIHRLVHSVREALHGPPPRAPSLLPARPTDPFFEQEQTTDELEQQPRSTPPSDRGAIEDTPFARVLGTLAGKRVSGGLMLQRGGVKKVVFFDDGVPVCVKSNLISECLGRVMVREKMLSEKDCDESVRRLKATGERQGAILVNMGCISPQNLMFALERQMELKLFELFTWTSGRYLFTREQKYSGPKLALALSPLQLVHEGIVRVMSVERVYGDLGRIENRIVVSGADATYREQALHINPKAGHLLDALDAARTVREVLDSADFDRNAAAILLYSLLSVGLAGLSGEVQRPHSSTTKSLRERQIEPPPIATGDIAQDLKEPIPEKSPLDLAREKASAAAEATFRHRVATQVPTPVLAPAPVQEVAKIEAPKVEEPQPTFHLESEKKPGEIDPELEATRDRLTLLNHYERLGVAKAASRDDIELAYKNLSLKYHPDRSLSETVPPELRALAEDVFLLIRRAHGTLVNDAARELYDTEIFDDVDSHSEGTAKPVAAEYAFQRGMKRCEKTEWKRAMRDFQLAVDRNPTEGAYLAHLAWASFSANPELEVAQRALRELDLAIERNPNLEEANVFRGLIQDKVGHRDAAIESYKRALTVNPDSALALSALARSRPSTKKGLLTRLGITD